MTLELLEAYGGIISNLKAIRAEREALKEFEQIQTGKRFLTIINQLDHAEQDQAEALKEIEEWLMQLEDPEMVSIIRWHYIVGYSWSDTNIEVYGYPDNHRARKKIFRYFGRE